MAKDRELAVSTAVGGVVYEAGTVPPPEVAEQITNPACWGDAPEPDDATDDEPSKPAAKKAAPRKSSS